jgi:hypothetical protein
MVAKFEKPINRETPPERLTDAEVVKVIKKINDPRVRADEDLEHFTVHLNGRVKFISKRDFIDNYDNKGFPIKIKIFEYIQDMVDKFDKAAEN